MESEAEFAYRSVYERSLEAEKQRKRSQAAQKQDTEKTTADVTAELPPRRPEQLDETSRREDVAEREADSVQESSGHQHAVSATEAAEGPVEQPVEIAGKPGPAYDALAPNPWFVPIFGRPADPKDVLTTQVLGQEPVRQAQLSQQAARTRGEQYCTNIIDEAADARFRWQQKSLLQTEEEIKERIEQLQQQIAEYKKWMARRDEFSKRAQEVVTDIYAKMRPEAAAQQLTALDELTAAAVLAKLNPRIASSVMAEMPPPQAARLTAIIAASARGPRAKRQAETQQDQGT